MSEVKSITYDTGDIFTATEPDWSWYEEWRGGNWRKILQVPFNGEDCEIEFRGGDPQSCEVYVTEDCVWVVSWSVGLGHIGATRYTQDGKEYDGIEQLATDESQEVFCERDEADTYFPETEDRVAGLAHFITPIGSHYGIGWHFLCQVQDRIY